MHYIKHYFNIDMIGLIGATYSRFLERTRRVGSDGSMSASGSAGPGFNPPAGY